MKPVAKTQFIGWVAVSLSIAIICFWAFWGIIENFHEGWYHESFLANLGLMFEQYLSPMLICMSVTLISIFWPKTGSALHMLLALFAIWFFHAFINQAALVLIMPLGSAWYPLLV